MRCKRTWKLGYFDVSRRYSYHLPFIADEGGVTLDMYLDRTGVQRHLGQDHASQYALPHGRIAAEADCYGDSHPCHPRRRVLLSG